MSSFIFGQEKYPSIDAICQDIAKGNKYFISPEGWRPGSHFNHIYYHEDTRNACAQFAKMEECLTNKEAKEDKECGWYSNDLWRQQFKSSIQYPWAHPYERLFEKSDNFGIMKPEHEPLDPYEDSVKHDIDNYVHMARKFQELEYENLPAYKKWFYKKFVEKPVSFQMPPATTTLEKLCESTPTDDNWNVSKTDRWCQRFQELLFHAAHGPTSRQMLEAIAQDDITTIALGHKAYGALKFNLGRGDNSEIKKFFDEGNIEEFNSLWEFKATLNTLIRRYHPKTSKEEIAKIQDEFLQKVQAVRKAYIAKAAENKI